MLQEVEVATHVRHQGGVLDEALAQRAVQEAKGDGGAGVARLHLVHQAVEMVQVATGQLQARRLRQGLAVADVAELVARLRARTRSGWGRRG